MVSAPSSSFSDNFPSPQSRETAPAEAAAHPATATLNKNDLLLFLTSHPSAILVHKHIHFAPHAEFRQINTRLDRKTSPWNHAPLIVRLQVVHIRAGPVNILADRMSQPMEEIIPEPLLANIAARRIVHFKPAQLLFRRHRLFNAPDPTIPSLRHHTEHL